MHPARTMVLGFACLVGSSAGCVSALSLRPALQAIADEQGAIVEGINGLDAACQRSQTSESGLAECRGPRDRARAALRKQLDGLKELAK